MPRGDHASAVGHLAVGERWAVFDDEDSASFHQFGRGDCDAARSLNHCSLRITGTHVLAHGFNVLLGRRINLVDYDDVGAAQVHFAGVVSEFVSRTVGIDDNDFQVG